MTTLPESPKASPPDDDASRMEQALEKTKESVESFNTAMKTSERQLQEYIASQTAIGLTPSEARELLLIVRRALLMVVRWIEKKYSLPPQ